LGKTQVSHAERVPLCGRVSDTDSVRRLSNYTRLSIKKTMTALPPTVRVFLAWTNKVTNGNVYIVG